MPNIDHAFCPLCHHVLDETVPAISQIYSSYEKIASTLSESQEQSLRNQKHIADLIKEETDIKNRIVEVENSIHALYRQKEESRKLRDLNVQRGKVIGRISLFLEKLQIRDSDKLDEDIVEKEQQIKELEKKISKNTKEEQMAAKTAVINSYMNLEWKHNLDLEDDKSIVTFDSKKLQIYTISGDEKYTPLDQMGSGANWVGFHLLIHFALHKFFVKNSRPIPRFLFLDQPSQIYFPSGREDISNSPDLEAVKRMFKFIIDRENELGAEFQVIITVHADIQDGEFQQNVIAKWYDGEKLIPEEWYNETSKY